MTTKVEAIYEDGVFKSLEPVKGIKSGKKVVLTVSIPSRPKPFRMPKISKAPQREVDNWIRAVEDHFFSYAHTKPSSVPVRKLEDLMGGWPKEERNDGFDKEFKRWRKKNVIRDRE